MKPHNGPEGSRDAARALLRGGAAALLCSSTLALAEPIPQTPPPAVRTALALAQPPARPPRVFFLVRAAVDEVLNFIDGGHASHLLSAPSRPVQTSREAAALSAVYSVLITVYRDEEDSLQARLQQVLAAIPEGAEKESGIILGKALAMTVYALLAGDGPPPAKAADAHLTGR